MPRKFGGIIGGFENMSSADFQSVSLLDLEKEKNALQMLHAQILQGIENQKMEINRTQRDIQTFENKYRQEQEQAKKTFETFRDSYKRFMKPPQTQSRIDAANHAKKLAIQIKSKARARKTNYIKTREKSLSFLKRAQQLHKEQVENYDRKVAEDKKRYREAKVKIKESFKDA